jgi:hypothetical protein
MTVLLALADGEVWTGFLDADAGMNEITGYRLKIEAAGATKIQVMREVDQLMRKIVEAPRTWKSFTAVSDSGFSSAEWDEAPVGKWEAK